MSPVVYDTAWLAMLSRVGPDGSGPFWVFPECFQYILDTQSLDPETGYYAGGWPSYDCPVDGIINTMAALLALLKHYRAKDTLRDATLPPNIWMRIENARDSLQAQLQDWDVQSSDRVGYDLLIPALLAMLEERPQQGESPGQRTRPAQSNCSFTFTFKGRAALMALHDANMAVFQPEWLYQKQQWTGLHSLEAFIGRIDFDKVRHHLTDESGMMGSPSSTSAYLMNCSTWDDRAENYLRMVVTESAGRGSGGVPCVFPTTTLEIAWVRYPTRNQDWTKSKMKMQRDEQGAD
jgi:aphidicolan-16beta-ol synthase/syn-copalyl-diphosphate synthase